jgi:hypothetical protein
MNPSQLKSTLGAEFGPVGSNRYEIEFKSGLKLGQVEVTEFVGLILKLIVHEHYFFQNLNAPMAIYLLF